LELEWKVEF